MVFLGYPFLLSTAAFSGGRAVMATFCALETASITATEGTGSTPTPVECSSDVTASNLCSEEFSILTAQSCVVTTKPDTTQVTFQIVVEGCDCATVSPCNLPSEEVTVTTTDQPSVCITDLDVAAVNASWTSEIEKAKQECAPKRTELDVGCETLLSGKETTCSEEVAQISQSCTDQTKAIDKKCTETKAVQTLSMEKNCKEKVAEIHENCTGKFFF